MIKKYTSFIKLIKEANVNSKIKRKDLKVGDNVMTRGDFDGVNLDYQVGKIIEMKEYGNILIEFEEPFYPKLHAGHQNIGKPKHCFYVPLDNISTNNREEFEKIIKGVGEEKKNKAARLNAEYKEGDVIVGIGELKQYRPPHLNIDGEVGIVYYQNGNGGINPDDRNAKNNKIYWVGFLDKFDKTRMNHDGEGMPKNNAGLNVDKIHMRLATEDEKERVKAKLEASQKDIEELKKTYDIGEVVVAYGDYNGVKFENNLGIVINTRDYGYGGRKLYSVRFLERFNDYLFDVDYLIGDNTGYQLHKAYLRTPTPEELEKNKVALNTVQEEIKEFNWDYKVGDYVITHGDMDGINMDGQIGHVLKIHGQKPNENFDIQFISKFTERLYKIGKEDNCYRLGRRNLSPSKDFDIEELKRKLEAKELMPFTASPPMNMLLNRMNLKIKTPFMTNSYFDVTDTNDTVSYLPVDKYRRLEGADDPYKSRLRQVVKVGKFLRMLNKAFTDRDVELLVNSYKASYDICISGLSDKLRLVSGEDVRYWYCEDQYVKGGGDLNASCMRYKNKGPEMQMFVDNPDVTQMLILTDEKNKLLGRALVWRLAEPPGATYMDYTYTRHDKDKELFTMYAEQHGWLSGDLAYRRGGRGGGLPKTMICALNTRKKYQMGKNALDHFDTLTTFNTKENYLTNDYNANNWKRPNPLPEDKPEEKKEVNLPFEINSKVLYKKAGAANDGKFGKFVGLRDDGKCKIIFDDGVKFAAAQKNVYDPEKEKEL
jgi:hypothetical protein